MSNFFWKVFEVIALGLLGVCGVLVVMILVLAPFAVSSEADQYRRLKTECLADGNPEYVCVSMLRGWGRR